MSYNVVKISDTQMFIKLNNYTTESVDLVKLTKSLNIPINKKDKIKHGKKDEIMFILYPTKASDFIIMLNSKTNDITLQIPLKFGQDVAQNVKDSETMIRAHLVNK